MALEKPMYNPIAFSPVATLTSDIAVGSTVIPVSDVNAFPPAPSYATIGTDENAETIKYSAKTADSLSGCTRAVEGVAQAWQTGEKIARNFTAADHQAIIDNLEQLNAGLQQAYSPNNKPTASDVGALPISGGTLTGDVNLTGTGWRSLTVGGYSANNRKTRLWEDANKQAVLENYTNDTNYTQLVLKDESARDATDLLHLVTRLNGAVRTHTIFGEHNKPRGTYVGNGSATQRTIATNALEFGNAVLIYSNNGYALITKTSGLIGNASSITPIAYETAHINNNTSIIIASTNIILNANGVTYNYVVL